MGALRKDNFGKRNSLETLWKNMHMIYVSFPPQWCLEVLEQIKKDYDSGRDWSQNTPLARESSMANKYTHTTPFYCHCRQMMLQPITDICLFVCLCVFVYICTVFLLGVFVNQALLNLKIITFMINQHHRRRSASCAKRKYIQPAREWEKERENDYISIIEQLADRDLINANLVTLVAISGIAMTFSS